MGFMISSRRTGGRGSRKTCSVDRESRFTRMSSYSKAAHAGSGSWIVPSKRSARSGFPNSVLRQSPVCRSRWSQVMASSCGVEQRLSGTYAFTGSCTDRMRPPRTRPGAPEARPGGTGRGRDRRGGRHGRGGSGSREGPPGLEGTFVATETMSAYSAETSIATETVSDPVSSGTSLERGPRRGAPRADQPAPWRRPASRSWPDPSFSRRYTTR